MTNEQIDEIIDSRVVPDELLSTVDDLCRQRMLDMGARLINRVIHMKREYESVCGTIEHVVVSRFYYEAITNYMGSVYPGLELATTVGGMKIIITTRPNIIEVY